MYKSIPYYSDFYFFVAERSPVFTQSVVKCRFAHTAQFRRFARPDGSAFPSLHNIGKVIRCLNHRKGTYTTLLTQCRLNAYLHDIDTVAKEQVRLITAQLAKSRGIDENLKAADALEWVAQMNSCKLAAEEIVMSEVIYR